MPDINVMNMLKCIDLLCLSLILVELEQRMRILAYTRFWDHVVAKGPHLH